MIIPDSINNVAFRDAPIVTNSSWSVWNGALFSRPRHVVYKTAIQLAVENVLKENYGSCNLCPTGPIVLGRAFAIYGDDISNLFFNLVQLTPGYNVKNPALVLSDGVIFAYLKNTGLVGLSSFNAIGTNSYQDMYSRKDIYN